MKRYLLASVINLLPVFIYAQSISLNPSADNTIFQNATFNSNGIGGALFAGVTNGSVSPRRALVKFDLSAIPPGSVITSVTLTLRVNKSKGSAPFSLYKLTSDWGEGASDAGDNGGGDGAGFPAEAGDATWLTSFYPATNWTTPGGDFVGTASATTTMSATGPYTWSAPQMIADVQAWLNTPASNFGWILKSDEVSNATSQRIASRESSNPSDWPELAINYTVPTPLHYRTVASGNWNSLATWESSPDLTTWTPATSTPDATSSTITVRNHNVTVTANVTIDQTTVQPLGSISVSGAILTVNSSGLLLQSNISGTARIGNSPAGIITGNVTVERFIPGKRAFRYLSHPFTSLTLAALQDDIDVTGTGGAANGFTTTVTNAPSAFRYDPLLATGPTDPGLQAGWVAFSNITNPWNQYKGISVVVRGAKGQGLDGNPYTPSAATIDLSGVLNMGTQNVQLVRGPNSYNNFNLVGNPFASNINLNTTVRGSGTGLNFYVWDLSIGTTGGYTTAAFANPYVLPSSASFFVEANDGVTPANNSIQFKESDKTAAAATNPLFRTSAGGHQLYLQLETGAITWDRMQFFFDDLKQSIKEPVDATKLMNPEVNFYSFSSDNNPLAIDYRPVTVTTVIPMGFKSDAPRNYTFRVLNLDLPVNIAAHIKDKYNSNALTMISAGSMYNFTVTADPASAAVDRFDIVFAPATPLPVTLAKVAAYQKGSGIQLDWSVSQEINMDKYEVEKSANGVSFSKLGTVASQGNSSVTVNYGLFDAAPFKGANYYRVKMLDNNRQVTLSKVVRVNIGSGKPAISIYPNPVVGNEIAIQLTNLEKGSYTFTLSNKLGQVVATKVVNHNGGSATETLQLESGLEAGTYQLVISGTDIMLSEMILRK